MTRWVALLGLVTMISSLVGVVLNFSEVPYMDQWNGYLGFWREIQNGHWSAWWRQHNEHRIIVSRLLFWLDIKYFDGLNIFTVLMNCVLQVALAGTFLIAYCRLQSRKISFVLVVGVVAVLRFSWMQGENWTWGFQSQFIAVYLFAVLAFLSNSMLVERRYGGLVNSMPVLFCALASGSMSNGLLALPVLVLQAIALRRNKKTIIFFCVASAVIWLLYFIGYEQPKYHASPLDGVIHHFPQVTQFFLIFLGGPAYFLSGSAELAMVTGAIVLLSTLGVAGVLLVRGAMNPYRTMLIATFGFATLSAFAASTGRWNFGIEAAEATRYMTPALLSWLACVLLFLDILIGSAFWMFTAFLALIVLPGVVFYQIHIADHDPQIFYRRVGVLSLKMGVDDFAYTDWLYPRSMHAELRDLATYSNMHALSVFGHSLLSEVGQVHFSQASAVSRSCKGSLDSIVVAGSVRRLGGWVSFPQVRKAILIVLVDEQNDTVGYGVSGDLRPDVDRVVPGVEQNSGWVGYVRGGHGAVRAYAFRDGIFCPLATVANVQTGPTG
ncbi:hypothetical protein A8H39_04315 [Paraburkholderia fungorum]|nr:hypothetical protein A8H39_04315 [Paraburkholderia fungorum]